MRQYRFNLYSRLCGRRQGLEIFNGKSCSRSLLASARLCRNMRARTNTCVCPCAANVCAYTDFASAADRSRADGAIWREYRTEQIIIMGIEQSRAEMRNKSTKMPRTNHCRLFAPSWLSAVFCVWRHTPGQRWMLFTYFHQWLVFMCAAPTTICTLYMAMAILC